MKKKTLGVLVALLLVVGVGVYTYSRYTTELTGEGKAEVAKWAVTVDGYDTQTESFDLSLTPETSEYVKTGKIAPGLSANGTIVLDLTGTEVDTEFTITLDESQLPAELVDSYSITVVAKNDTFDSDLTLNDGNNYTGSISYEDIATNPEISLDVTIEWDYADSAVVNSNDTTIGETVAELTIPVTVTAKQKVS